MNTEIKGRLLLGEIWFSLLLLSFSYEKPIFYFSTIDRLNPRLYDFATLLGLLWIILYGRRITKSYNGVYKSYKLIVIWFAISTLLSIVLYDFPLSIDAYSLYFLIRYLQELFIYWIVIQFLNSYSINYDYLFKLLIIGGVFVSFYCLYEYSYQVTEFIEIAPGKTIIKPKGYVWGPFTAGYFQIANYSPIIGFISFSYAMSKKGITKWLYLIISSFILWPSFFSGSRTAIGFVFILFFIAAFKEVRFRYLFIFIIIVGLLVFTINMDLFQEIIYNTDNQTFRRLILFEEDESLAVNSISGRVNFFFEWFNRFKQYTHQGLFVPFFGGGFYVAPIKGYYRIGYGWHNIFIFSIEQAGLLGFILFMGFIKRSLQELKMKIRRLDKKHPKFWFTFAIQISFLAMIFLGFFGAHSFWRGFATGNFNTFRVLMLIIASHSVISFKNNENI